MNWCKEEFDWDGLPCRCALMEGHPGPHQIDRSEEFRRDAARYRWLEKQLQIGTMAGGSFFFFGPKGSFPCETPPKSVADGVDAAMENDA